MPTFVLMSRLAPEAVKDEQERRAMGREWLKAVHEACPEVRFLSHHALLGPWDFMDLYGAADVETAHKVALISRAQGARTVESWPAMPYEEFLQVLRQIAE